MSSFQWLLEPFDLDHGAVPFDRLREDLYAPAFDEALKRARSAIGAIRDQAAEPDFANTLEALELASSGLDQSSQIFFNLLETDGTESMRALGKEVSPKLAEFSNDVILDAKLFARIQAVYESSQKGTVQLDGEQKRLLEKVYRNFKRNGALLPEDRKARLREIDQRLAFLSQQFSEHLLHSSQAFVMDLNGEADLKGLPESAREAAAALAKEKRDEGKTQAEAVVTLDAPSYIPFMKFSERRDLREKLWRAYLTRASSGEWDNRPVLLETAKLRHERAQLLGYESHAAFVLEERMASNAPTVKKFLDGLLQASRRAAEKDLDEVRAIAKRDGGEADIRPWDFGFWSERLKKEKYSFDEEELRPYFPLEKCVEGVFEHARRLYGLEFKERRDLPVYHPEVRVFEVTDKAGGGFVGLFYADFHPRPTKRGGAWMTNFREQGLAAVSGGKTAVQRPLVSIVCNMTKPVPGKPALLTLDEVRTLFHEFGHSLHSLLSKCHYRSLAGTNVYWDFVELPSQIMENWVKEKEGLDLFARHYQTGESIPAALVQKIKDSSRFQAGYMSLRQLNFGYLDMAWHSQDPARVGDVEAFETQATRSTSLFEHIDGTLVSPGFSHVFAGGYSAGYYSYKWAEVLEADAFELFQEKGVFNRDVATKFKDTILSRGGSEHPMELYKRFRGREPDPSALLRRDGLL
ncbi:MAG TPA: M3 family metallopeptidase [Bdellovibrionota bacterium]|nr:M3 family metallopeptidase [Bdellovibrionota bacterium]